MLVTLGIAFIIADVCLLVWTGDPWTVPAPPSLRRPLLVAGFAFPTYRLVVAVIALVAAIALYFLMERTRLGAMIRAGVDDMEMARGVGIPVSMLFTVVFLLGPCWREPPGRSAGRCSMPIQLDADMLPLALIVVILGGAGSLLGAFVGSFVVGFLYNFGIALFPTRLLHPVPAHAAGARVHAAGLVRADFAMNRTSIAVALAAAAGVAVPWIISNDYYVNLASQILIYASLLALSLNLLLGYGGMVSLGHAAFLGLTGYSTILLVLAGYDQLTTAILSVVFSTACGALFGVLALRVHRFLMITLALGQIVWGVAYRANALTGGDNGITLPARPAVRHRYQFCLELLLFHPDRVCDRLVLHLAADALAVRRGAVRHPRPAAPHVHAGPQCVDGAVADVRDRLLSGGQFRACSTSTTTCS